jgi:hypothetical protein
LSRVASPARHHFADLRLEHGQVLGRDAELGELAFEALVQSARAIEHGAAHGLFLTLLGLVRVSVDPIDCGLDLTEQLWVLNLDCLGSTVEGVAARNLHLFLRLPSFAIH